MARPHPYCYPPTCFVPRMPDRLFCSVFRNVLRRVPHLNKDTSVRARAFHLQLTRRPREHSHFTFSLLHAAPRGPCSALWNKCSRLGLRRSSLYSPLSSSSSALAISKMTRTCATWVTRMTGVTRSRHPSQYSFFSNISQ